jgi:pilus assembly protein CpaB
VGTRRTKMVLAAVVLGAVASLTLYRHVRTIESQVYADARQVEVVVATVDVPKGTTGDRAIADALMTRLMPAEFRPATAITDVEELRGKVANMDIPAGVVVVRNTFVDHTQAVAGTNAQRIPDGMVAISISVDQVRGVAGLIRPGDRVNLIIDDPNRPDAPTKQVLFQNVEVLFVGRTPAPQPGQDPAVAASAAPAELEESGLLTLAVPPVAASKIALVSDAGIHLALVPPGNTPVPVPPISGDNLFTGELVPSDDVGGIRG